MSENKQMKYFVSTYSEYSHNYLIAILGSQQATYRFEKLQNEETYSKFEVICGIEVYNLLRNVIDQNNGTAISIEYGPY